MGTVSCTMENNTKYTVKVVNYCSDTFTLKPGESQSYWLYRGPYHIDLVMELSDTKEVKIKFPGSQYENRTHKLSVIFAEHIREFEMSSGVRVSGTFSRWHLALAHPGGYEAIETIKLVNKNSWKHITEKGYEAEAKIAASITEAIQMSASFKTYTKLTRVDQYESEISSTMERKFKDPCYIWQEIVCIETNKAAPFHELQIPTNNLVNTSTNQEPGKEMFLFTK